MSNYINLPVEGGGGGGGGVSSLNGLTGALVLVAGANVSITPGVSTLTIASTGANSALSNLTTTAINQPLNLNLGIQIGTVDPFSRTQIWNYAPNAVLRLGSLGQDGDPTDVTSEGIVSYGPDLQGDPMSSASGDFGYARIKSNRFGLYNSKSNSPGYYFRVDPTSLFLADNSYVKTFEVDRLTGNLLSSGTLAGSNLSGTNTGDVTIGTANGLSILGQVLSLQLASGSQPGALSATNWNTFNNKQNALTIPLPVAQGGTALSTVPANGQLLIGDGVGYVQSNLTAGAGISIINNAGAITVVNTSATASINIDGGTASSVYGGISPIDAGGA